MSIAVSRFRRRAPHLAEQEVTVRGECGNCHAHTKVRLPFKAMMLPGSPIYMHCTVCPGWSVHEIVAIEKA